MKHRSSRIIARVIVFLLLGAIFNVAVAWGIAVLAGAVPIREGFYRELSSEAANAYWSRHAPAEWHDAVILDETGVEGWAFGRANLMVIAEDAARRRLVAAGHEDMGWPSLALRFTSRHVVVKGVEQVEPRWDWRVNVSWFKGKTLPLLPLWPGFAINTVFYAAVLWMLFAAPFALRRRRRIKRGLCARCGYPVGASDVCTECGQAFTVALTKGRTSEAAAT